MTAEESKNSPNEIDDTLCERLLFHDHWFPLLRLNTCFPVKHEINFQVPNLHSRIWIQWVAVFVSVVVVVFLFIQESDYLFQLCLVHTRRNLLVHGLHSRCSIVFGKPPLYLLIDIASHGLYWLTSMTWSVESSRK